MSDLHAYSSASGSAGGGGAAPPPAANIRVYVRVRPINARERESGGTSAPCLSVHAGRRTVELHARPESRLFAFDHVADADATQEDVFAKVGRPITDACLAGYNGTIFAYGQTGSGKTFTIQGGSDGAASSSSPSELRGLMPRVFEYLTAQISLAEGRRGSHSKVSFTLKASFLEIYNERVYDLLEPTTPALALREDARRGVYVEGLTEAPVRTAKDLSGVMERGVVARRVGETAMNRESSRSHCVFTLHISSSTTSSSGVGGPTVEKHARFSLIDLAGSERAKTTQATGARMDEAKNINRSLSALGNVIRELMKRSTAGGAKAEANAGGAGGASSTGGGGGAAVSVSSSSSTDAHIPYRDSKLTFLLRDSLGGNSLTFLIACVSSSGGAFFESMSTLKFATMANTIRNNAKVNELQLAQQAQLQSAAVEALRGENEKLKAQVQRMLAAQGLGNRRLSLMPGLMASAATAAIMGHHQPGLLSPAKLQAGSSSAGATAVVPLPGSSDSSLPGSSGCDAAASEQEQRLQTLLSQSQGREAAWAAEIDAYKAQLALHERKQQVDAMLLRLRDKHIAALQGPGDASAATAALRKELDLLKQSSTQLTHVPSIIAARDQIQILLDRIADLEQGGDSSSPSVGAVPAASAPRHRVEFELQSQLVALAEKHAEVSAAFSALQSRSPASLLAEMDEVERHAFESFEVAQWTASQDFEGRLRAAHDAAQSERDMVAHLEAQLAHALDTAASERREHEEALLLKNGYILRAENERANMARALAALEEQQAAQSAAARAAQGNQQAEAAALSARLSAEVDAWKSRAESAESERATATQECFESSQRVAVLQHQHDHLVADARAAARLAEENKAARLAEQAAAKAQIEALEAQIADLTSQTQSLSSDLSSSRLEVSSLSSSLRAAESETSSLSSRLDGAREELESCMFKLEGVQEDCDTLNGVNSFQADQLAEAQTAANEANKALAEKVATVESLQSTIATRDAALQSLRAELEQAQQANNYEAEFLALQAHDAMQGKRLEELGAELDAALQALQQGAEEQAASNRERDALASSKAALERSVAELTAALQDYSSRLATQTASLDRAEAELAAAQESVGIMMEKEEQLRGECNEAQEALHAKEEEAHALQLDLTQLRGEKEHIASELQQAETALQEQSQAHEAAQSALAASREAEAAAQQELAVVRTEVEQLHEASAASAASIASLTSQKADLERQLSDIVAMASQLESGAQAAEQRSQAQAAGLLEQARHESASLRAQVDSLTVELSKVRADFKDRRAEFDKQQTQFAHMLAQFETHKRARDEEVAAQRTALANAEAALASARRDASQAAAEKQEHAARVASLERDLSHTTTELGAAREAALVSSQDSAIALELQGEVGALMERVSILERERHQWLVELESSRADEAASISAHASLASQLAAAQESLHASAAQVHALTLQVSQLAEQNAALTGHNNPKQKIQLHMQIKRENESLRADKAALERELRKFRKAYALWSTAGAGGGAAGALVGSGGGASAGSLEKDLQLADDHLRQGEQAQTQLRALMAHIAAVDTKVRNSAAIHAPQQMQTAHTQQGQGPGRATATLTDSTHLTAGDGAADLQGAAAAASSPPPCLEESFPACLSSLSTLSLQLCSAHAQSAQLRQELAAISKQSRLQAMREQLQRAEQQQQQATLPDSTT